MQTPATVACCLCGTPTSADATLEGRCLACLAVTMDVGEGVERSYDIEMCRTCAMSGTYKWFRNPQWVVLEPESAELLSLCVRRIRSRFCI